MFYRRREQTELETAVERALRELNRYEVGSDEYNKALDAANTLHTMRIKETPSLVSKDTLILAGTNLVGILMVIKHENLNVIVSKAINMLMRVK